MTLTDSLVIALAMAIFYKIILKYGNRTNSSRQQPSESCADED